VNLWLDPIPHSLRDQAQQAVAEGDALNFLCKASNEDGLELVIRNMQQLKKSGIYEATLLEAFTGTRTNNRWCPVDTLRDLFLCGERERFLAAGDALPEGDKFSLYRGVAGRGAARRVRGLSWTANRERAEWFAKRAFLHDPAIYTVMANRSDIWAYTNQREEEEFIVLLPAQARVKRIASLNDREAGHMSY
jgi:hypothetical protein